MNNDASPPDIGPSASREWLPPNIFAIWWHNPRQKIVLLASVAVFLASIAVMVIFTIATTGKGDLIAIVEKRLVLCDFNPAEYSFSVSQAEIVANSDLVIGNTGEHPDSDYNFLSIPMLSPTFDAGDTSHITLWIRNDDGEDVIGVPSGESAISLWPGRCLGSDSEVRQAMSNYSDPGSID